MEALNNYSTAPNQVIASREQTSDAAGSNIVCCRLRYRITKKGGLDNKLKALGISLMKEFLGFGEAFDTACVDE